MVAWFPAVQAFDEAILRVAHGHPRAAIPLFHFFTVVGGGWPMLLLVPLIARRATRTTALWLLFAVVLTSATVSTVKEIVGRVRPCDALDWCAAISVPSPGGHSFPSGHAAGSFAFAAFAAVRTPRWAAPALIYAAIVAWSRCVLGVHYPSDVLTGALLGTAIGVAVARYAMTRARRLTAAQPAAASAQPGAASEQPAAAPVTSDQA
jgi:undecaprenyl-diphosphatase